MILGFIRGLLTVEWQRKLVAIVAAVIIYTLVNGSITTSMTLTNVQVRVENLPEDLTVEGLLPDGTLTETITLTLHGKKAALSSLTPGDVEVIASGAGKSEDWILKVSRRNLRSLNPEIDLISNVTDVRYTDYLVKVRPLVTAKIPIRFPHPIGEPPEGFQFLDTWPQRLEHTISGPEDQLEDLEAKGFELTWDLSTISREELDGLGDSPWSMHEDEVSYPVPAAWKRVAIPFLNDTLQTLNDPDAAKLTINFLKQEMIPLDWHIPIRVFYPAKYRDTINPDTYDLEENSLIEKVDGIYVLKAALFARGVSRFFVDIARDSLEITVKAAPKSEQERLDWSIQVINPEVLESRYVDLLTPTDHVAKQVTQGTEAATRAELLRHRFRDYMRTIRFFREDGEVLDLKIELQGNAIHVEVDNE
ncbi:MAG: hypothetical protein CMO81_00365 [Waddliaceae bacterium]|nr:hypothetical protein [Waddliaceae bacterium]